MMYVFNMNLTSSIVAKQGLEQVKETWTFSAWEAVKVRLSRVCPLLRRAHYH